MKNQNHREIENAPCISAPHNSSVHVEKPPLRDLCRQYNIRLKKRLGQNLLLDDNIHRIMIEAGGLNKEDAVIEVGAGLGALTWHIVHYAGRVLAVEIDPSFMPCLENRFGHLPHVKLFRGDILNHEISDLIDTFLPGASHYKMLSNLPYYITTPVLFHFLECSVNFERIVVMVQYEVGARMSAIAGTKDYGVLSLAVQSLYHVDLVHFVPRTCFVPRPEVDSCIVRLRKINPPIISLEKRKHVLQVIHACFSQRRKNLKNALGKSPLLQLPMSSVLEGLQIAGIDPTRRAETLTWDDFVRLTEIFETLRSEKEKSQNLSH
ncbi:MAG: 16S rRNA (adenine(1518)-N(6)/adenine(1519)-N(6))-dimethyltransferase RsmA [Candidatus Hydrogenedens sp.]|nr:16S rRNA (adenine(1518)-N(6)/adenine(1519)-N(6))-dimethyltransferase RsmA [Candidatus Hydrogenedens sp.]